MFENAPCGYVILLPEHGCWDAKQKQKERQIIAMLETTVLRMAGLIDNVLDFARGRLGGGITLDRDSAAPLDRLFELSVANGGEPIPEAALDKVFEPFFRGKVRPSRQGLGLGLHIASQIAKAHEGTLTATSTSEETCFTFVMPLRSRS